MSVPTLADVKTQLRITNTTYDAELTTYLAAALSTIEDRVGPSSVQSFTDNITAHGNGLNLTKRPVVSLTSCTPLLNTFPTFLVTDLQFDATSGIVFRKDLGTMAGAYAVTYTAGWSTFPDKYRLATLFLVQDWWTTKRGTGDRRGVDVMPGITGQPLPDMVMALIADAPFYGGIA